MSPRRIPVDTAVTDGCLPAIVHWGAEVRALGPADLELDGRPLTARHSEAAATG